MKKIVLIQVREKKDVANDEYALFRRCFAGEHVRFDRHNTFSKKLDPEHIKRQYDGIILGGSPFAPGDAYPQKKKLRRLVVDSIEKKVPFLGVCFGFEVLIKEIGGKIVINKIKGHEFGTRRVYLTAAGKKDPLFRGLPEKFLVQENHHWYCPNAPAGTSLLSRGNAVRCQAVRWNNGPIYGVQYHPELDVESMHFRIQEYKDGSASAMSSLRYARVRPTPKAPLVIRNFVRNIVI